MESGWPIAGWPFGQSDLAKWLGLGRWSLGQEGGFSSGRSGLRSGEEIVLQGQSDRLGPIGRAQLRKDAADVVLDGRDADE